MTSTNWFVYMLRCADDSLYTGVAMDLQRRLQEHNDSDTLAARYTRARRPVVLVYSETAVSRSQACRREAAIKKLCKVEKERLVASGGMLAVQAEVVQER